MRKNKVNIDFLKEQIQKALQILEKLIRNEKTDKIINRNGICITSFTRS